MWNLFKINMTEDPRKRKNAVQPFHGIRERVTETTVTERIQGFAITLVVYGSIFIW